MRAAYCISDVLAKLSLEQRYGSLTYCRVLDVGLRARLMGPLKCQRSESKTHTRISIHTVARAGLSRPDPGIAAAPPCASLPRSPRLDSGELRQLHVPDRSGSSWK
jgi:hypothetical protein